MTHHPLYDLASETAKHLKASKSLAKDDYEVASAFSHALGSLGNVALPDQSGTGAEVRALRYAPLVLGTQPRPEHRSIFETACRAFGLVRWSEFYAEDDWSRPFLGRFANGEGLGPDGKLRHLSLILGLFILGPNTLYPAHSHPAEEFYIVLTGDPEWQIGAGTSYREIKEGSVMIHRSEMSHSIRTSEKPFFAIYGWRGRISAPSWYRDDMTDVSSPVKYPTIRK